jgi:hypothetical protein
MQADQNGKTTEEIIEIIIEVMIEEAMIDFQEEDNLREKINLIQK